MTKLLATTTLLLTLLVSPLMAEEKILKCYLWGEYDEALNIHSFYKMKTSLFGGKSYYLRDGVEWVTFCKGKNSAMIRKDFSPHTPIKKIKGDNAVSCLFSFADSIRKQKLAIDFDLYTSSYCSENKNKDWDCTTYGSPYKCERIVNE